MYLNKETNASYNFVAPNISEDENKKVEVAFPTSEKKDVTLSANKAEVDIKRNITIVDLGSDALTTAAVVTLIPDSQLPIGAKVYVKWTNGTAAVGVNVKKDSSAAAVNLPGAASSTVTRELLWTGTDWLLVG